MPHLRGYSGLLGVWEGSLCVDRHISRVGGPTTAIFRPTPAPQVTPATKTPPAPTSGRRPLSRVRETTRPFVRARTRTHIRPTAAEPSRREISSLRACPAGQATRHPGSSPQQQTGLPGRSSPGPAPLKRSTCGCGLWVKGGAQRNRRSRRDVGAPLTRRPQPRHSRKRGGPRLIDTEPAHPAPLQPQPAPDNPTAPTQLTPPEPYGGVGVALHPCIGRHKHPVAPRVSAAAAMSVRERSAPRSATNCSPTGQPSCVKPAGMLAAG